jgi:hypothetical protein
MGIIIGAVVLVLAGVVLSAVFAVVMGIVNLIKAVSRIGVR